MYKLIKHFKKKEEVNGLYDAFFFVICTFRAGKQKQLCLSVNYF